MQARLIEFREIAPDVRHFVFEAEGIEHVPYEPGQFVSFSAEIAGRRVTRAYSLAAPPNGNRLELCLNRVRDGLFSSFLFGLEQGDKIDLKGPLGTFVLRQPVRDSLFVATGTGIAPFRAMLQAALPAYPDRQFTLLFGVRYETGLLYRAELEQLARDYLNLRFWPTLTRPDPSWQGRAGRVQQHLVEAIGGRTDLDIYVCGLKEMVDEVRALLKSLGFDRKQILYEKYN